MTQRYANREFKFRVILHEAYCLMLRRDFLRSFRLGRVIRDRGPIHREHERDLFIINASITGEERAMKKILLIALVTGL